MNIPTEMLMLCVCFFFKRFSVLFVAYLLCELFPHSMVKSSMAVHDLRRSLFKPIVCCAGHIPLLVAAVKSGNDGHEENKRDALN